MVKFLFDYDSTLADTTRARIDTINSFFGKEYVVDGVVSWNNSDKPYLTNEEDAWSWGPECFLSETWQSQIPPVEGAIEGVQSLLEAGHTGMVVSDRPPVLFEVTRDWLDRQGLDTVRLLFTRHKHSKSGDHKGLTKNQAAYLYKLTHVVEDAPHHGMALANREYVQRVFLLEAPYNKGVYHPKITRIESWNDVKL